jgi:hypothetical protein
MKQLRAARPREADDVLQVGRTSSERADRGRVCEAAPRSEKADDRQSAPDLEAAVRDVSVRHAIAGKMKRDAKQSRHERGANSSAHRRARSCM